MDTLTPAQRSERMSRVKGKGSAAERRVRSLVHRLGFRFRLHGASLPRKPDLVFATHAEGDLRARLFLASSSGPKLPLWRGCPNHGRTSGSRSSPQKRARSAQTRRRSGGAGLAGADDLGMPTARHRFLRERNQNILATMNSIELFAGAGGLGMGLHLAGFHPQAVVEWDHDCCETLRENQVFNHPLVRDWPLTEGDVRQVSFKGFEDRLDLISGGPPCQPFSLGGKHKAHDDARDMFPQAIRAVREARPKAFVFENVKGLTRAAFRNYFEYIKLQLEHPEIAARGEEDWTEHLARLERHHTDGARDGLHYRVRHQGLERRRSRRAADARERVLFVGFRDDLDLEWNFPITTHSADALLWDQHRRRRAYWERHKVAERGSAIRIRGRHGASGAPGRANPLPALGERCATPSTTCPIREPSAKLRARSPITAFRMARAVTPATPAAPSTSRPRP